MALALRRSGGTVREDSILVPQLRFMPQRGGSWPLAVAPRAVQPPPADVAEQEADVAEQEWLGARAPGLLMSASNQVTAFDLHERISERVHRNSDSFRIVQERVYARIARCAQVAPTHKSIWFEVPAFLVGRPPFDVQRCTELLSGNLRANGYKVTHFPPRLLFVTWDLSAPARRAPRLVVGPEPPPRGAEQRGDALAPDRTVALPPAADYRPISDFRPRAKLMLGL